MAKIDEDFRAALQNLQGLLESERAIERSAQRLRAWDRWTPRAHWGFVMLALGFILTAAMALGNDLHSESRAQVLDPLGDSPR